MRGAMKFDRLDLLHVTLVAVALTLLGCSIDTGQLPDGFSKPPV